MRGAQPSYRRRTESDPTSMGEPGATRIVERSRNPSSHLCGDRRAGSDHRFTSAGLAPREFRKLRRAELWPRLYRTEGNTLMFCGCVAALRAHVNATL